VNPVIVTWLDAWGDSDEVTLGDATELHAYRTFSVGWLVHKTEEYIVVAMDCYEEKEGTFKNYAYIPLTLVEHIYPLPVPPSCVS